jgi:hypothetical protein
MAVQTTLVIRKYKNYIFITTTIFNLSIVIISGRGIRTKRLHKNKKNKYNAPFCNKINNKRSDDKSSYWKYTKRNKYHKKGCDDKSCEKAVCKCDPYYCEFSWDLSCQGSKEDEINECSASLLCCEYDSEVDESFRDNISFNFVNTSMKSKILNDYC